ncbi:MAG: hypothetical protein ACK4TP_02990 [Hyphomicrobium sp.]
MRSILDPRREESRLTRCPNKTHKPMGNFMFCPNMKHVLVAEAPSFRVSQMFPVALLRNGPRTAAVAPWGEGLIDQSVSDWWYPVTWDTVAPDELVVLNPSLAAQPLCTGKGAEPFLRRALSRRLAFSVHVFNASVPEFHLLAAHAAMCDPTAIGVDPAADTESAATDPYFGWLDTSQKRLAGASAQELVAFELAAIRSIALLSGAANSSEDPRFDGIDLGQTLVASIHSGLNGAYVCPSLAFAHELLAVGTWLGHVLRGRPALMPSFIADACADWLSPRASGDQCTAILQMHAEIAVGQHELLKAARRVRSKGYPVKVLPRRSVADVAPLVWNRHLFNSLL